MRHLTLAFRTLFKTPFVTGIAVVSLALGIGANAAIFSLFDQILLRPLPVPEPGRLVNLAAPGLKPGSQSCGQAGDRDVVFSYPMFRDLERAQSVFTGLAAHLAFGVSLSYRDRPTTGDGMYVSGSYFPTLGLRPALGRLLGPTDDQSIGTNYVAVLGYGYWQSHFGSDPRVLGRPLVVNGQAMTIVGVAPRDFQGTTLGVRPLVFVPISMRGVLEPGFRGFENRQSYWAYLFGRLKPDVSLTQASAGLNAVYHPIVTDVEAPLQKGISDQQMTQFRAKQVVVTPGRRGQSSMHRDAKAPLLMLFSVTAIVLLIACANIANLLLARGAGRAMDMGVRLALGARRGQLITQLLTESVVLACLGAVAGLLVAYWTLAGIATLAPPEVVGALGFGLRPVVLVFAALLALATGIVFGVFPAWHSTRTELVTTIRANAGQISGARSAARVCSSPTGLWPASPPSLRPKSWARSGSVSGPWCWSSRPCSRSPRGSCSACSLPGTAPARSWSRQFAPTPARSREHGAPPGSARRLLDSGRHRHPRSARSRGRARVRSPARGAGLRGPARARHGDRVRRVPCLAQHPHGAGHDNSRQRRPDLGSTERRPVPLVAGHRPDRPGHHAAHRRGAVREEPGQRDPRGSRGAGRRCGHVPPRARTDRLRQHPRLAALRPRGGRGGRDPRRERCDQLGDPPLGRVQLGLGRLRARLPVRPRRG